MKEIISGTELKNVMSEAVNLIGDAVSLTLGPTGNNVLIDTDDVSPFITNDGVTISNAVSVEDKKIDVVLDIIKEAAFKTNEKVGDGTTTTLVLLQSIFDNGLKEINNGTNAITLKKELEMVLDEIILKIKKMSKKPTKKDLVAIASISANDYETGLFLEPIFSKMKNRYAIKLQQGKSEKTYYEIQKGYNLEIDNIPIIYFAKDNELIINNVYILLIRGYLSDLESIANIINEGLERNKNMVILVDDYDENVANQVVSYYLQRSKNIYLFKLPDYALRKEEIIKDLQALTNTKVIDLNYDECLFSNLGYMKQLLIKKEEIIIINDADTSKRIKELKTNYSLSNNEYDKEFLSNCLSKLENGMATIYVGGKTDTEIKEKLMRYDDALWALEMAKDGVLIGEGLTLLKISEEVSNEIMRTALKAPFQKIMQNALGEYKEIESEIIKANYQKIYNFETGNFESINNTKIIDPTNVTIEALKNAFSIATMLLTTNCLIINENFKVDNQML